jgi:tetratricopeptide (TPR) repeat protein
MRARQDWLRLGVLCLIGPCLLPPTLRAQAPATLSAAQTLPVQRQDARRQGEADRLVRCYEQSLASFPEHHVVRANYAELLLRLHRTAEARAQFERFVADVQDDPQLAKHLVHCHSRLMEIAQEEGDDYAEHLHRGIGLYLLARERAELPDDVTEDELTVEAVLCKAAGELTVARMARRDEARPCWYLYAVWSSLGQRQPALRHLRLADALAPFSDLTPAEKRDLALACLGRDADARPER